MTGYDRRYAARLLRNHGRRVELKPSVSLQGDVRTRTERPVRRKYGPEVLRVLEQLWEMMDFICGKRLAPALSRIVPRLRELGELRASKKICQLLLQMSPATIDRLLRPSRQKHQLRGRALTKPGTLLKHQIPIRTFAQWDDACVGFLEIDLVGHCGADGQGEYCYTLDMVDVTTGWTEQFAVRNKAQIWVFEAIKIVRNRLPFKLLGLDSDNGSEFINKHLQEYCRQEKLTFTRSRTTHKNDTCHVEQKNWSVVRRFVGYGRYESEPALSLLNTLYEQLRLYTNYFLPSMKLLEKVRDGAKLTRRHDPAKTPYERLLDAGCLDKAQRQKLCALYKTLNPAALHREIKRIQQELDKIAIPGAVQRKKPLKSDLVELTGGAVSNARQKAQAILRKHTRKPKNRR